MPIQRVPAENRTRARSLLAGLLLATLLAHAPAPAALQDPETPPPPPAPAAAAGPARIDGRVVARDGRSGVGQAVVRASHLRTGRSFASAPSRADGEFTITGLPYGYVEIAVETAEGVFRADQVVDVPPSGEVTIGLTLVPGATGEGGVAVVRQRSRTVPFWKTPKGLALIGGGAGVALLVIATSDDEEPASPF